VVVPVIRDTWVWSKVRIHSSRVLQTQLSMPRGNPVGCSIQCLRERKTVKIDTPSIITQTMLSSKQRSTILVTACTFKISTALRVRLLTPTLKKERRRPMEFSPISNLLWEMAVHNKIEDSRTPSSSSPRTSSTWVLMNSSSKVWWILHRGRDNLTTRSYLLRMPCNNNSRILVPPLISPIGLWAWVLTWGSPEIIRALWLVGRATQSNKVSKTFTLRKTNHR
jgi:hypothetical protein